MKVIKIAQVPPPVISEETTVVETAQFMKKEKVGAVGVTVGRRLVGIVSERDLMLRVVACGRDPKMTSVAEIMTSEIETTTGDTETSEALEIMVSKHIRHLPIVDKRGNIKGLLSLRNLLQHHVENLVDELNSLTAYFTADGPGG